MVRLLDGEALVAEARPGAPELEPPEPPSLAEAERAAAAHVHFSGENFAECFTCGFRPDDGLCIHVGPVAGTDLHAAPWTAAEVSPEIVWAAIDCPGAWAVGGPGRGEVVLGRMAAEIVRLPAEGEVCIVDRMAARGGRPQALRRYRAVHCRGRAARARAPDLDSAEDRVAGRRVEAVGREDRDPDAARPEGVAPVGLLDLRERVRGEAPRPLEPRSRRRSARTPRAARSRCRRCRGRCPRPFSSVGGPARQTSSAPASTSSSSR